MDLSDIRAKISELEQRHNQVQCSLGSTFFQGAGNLPLSIPFIINRLTLVGGGPQCGDRRRNPQFVKAFYDFTENYQIHLLQEKYIDNLLAYLVKYYTNISCQYEFKLFSENNQLQLLDMKYCKLCSFLTNEPAVKLEYDVRHQKQN
ncbi:unnamed protein product [Paramecium pentaurelia]|uniref:Uncharacterized protein n=1 Tax=Paramecium pentaurelia TaxID=43138 RepID=A0A8S1YJF7_9CILI|nr:unnamed protein product [Paramecium pentaurelia]